MLAEARRRAYLEALDIDVYSLRRTDSGGDIDAGDAAADTAPDGEASADWPALQQAVAACTRCPLHRSRTQTVFGVGDRHAQWMIIGEAPGAEEDRRGEPFVGRAGQLLDEMLRAIGLDRQTAFIANLLKCRPPHNRDPSAEETSSCRSYLDRQIELVAPRIILAVGRIAAQHLLATDAPVGQLRGKQHVLGDRQIPLIVTYHPAYLLRSPTQKRKAWQDLVLARQVMKDRQP